MLAWGVAVSSLCLLSVPCTCFVVSVEEKSFDLTRKRARVWQGLTGWLALANASHSVD